MSNLRMMQNGQHMECLLHEFVTDVSSHMN